MVELWDLSATVERMAVAMWAQEAYLNQSWATAERRTLNAFRNEASETQGKWIGLASAGLEAAFNTHTEEDQNDGA